MRVVTLSVLVLLATTAFGVFGHHMLTIGSERIAKATLALSLPVSTALCFVTMGAAKKERSLALRVSAAFLLFVAAYGFFDSLHHPILPLGYWRLSVAAGVIPAAAGIILLTTKKLPNHPAEPASPSQAGSS